MSIDNHRFIDALREVIGLVPLYCFGGARPSYERQALEAMGRAIGDGNRRVVTTVGLENAAHQEPSDLAEQPRELSPRELARLRASKPLRRGSHRLNGQRVGMAFVTLGRRA